MQKNMNTSHFDKILVVDDATANLQLLTNLLTAHGYTVYPASAGKLALEFIRSILPDLILLDIRMPGMDGYEVCRRLKADERTRSIPIMFISILEDEGDKVKGFQAGAVDYITKPFQPEEVLARVRIHLRLRELTEHLEHTVAERTTELHVVNVQLQRELAERKQAQAKLARERALLRCLIDSVSDLIFIKDLNGVYQGCNKAGEAFIGMPECEQIGKSDFDFFDREKSEEIRKADRRVLEDGKPLRIEEWVTGRDGRRLLMDTLKAPYYDPDGEVLGLVGVGRDITERKRAEEEVRFLKNYLANIIDSMPAILVGIDRHETVTQWNRQAEALTGISAAAAVGRPLAILLPDFAPWIAAMQRDLDQQRHAVVEKRFIEKEGGRRFYDLLLYPLLTNGVEGAVIRIEDVTEQTRLQDLMIQTEKMISLGGLAAGMAHEINNPLHIILQAAQNIERRVSPELPANRQAAEALDLSLERMQTYFTQRQLPAFLGSIHTAASRAARIVANMLQFSRRAGTTRQPASLTGILDQAVELAASDYDLKKKYDFRSIAIIRDYAPEMPEVTVATVEIEQALLNLLKNAAQALIVNPPDRPPRITLRLRRNDRYAVIEVEDNGPGMDETIRRRVFEPFFTTKEPGVGTGLGLSVAYMIITQNHKGLLEAASTPGKGACFTIRLPLSRESIQEHEHA